MDICMLIVAPFEVLFSFSFSFMYIAWAVQFSCTPPFICGIHMNNILVYTGQLSAVGDLSVISNANSVTISWSAPFSLDVTGVIWYSVLVYNVTDENNTAIIFNFNVTTRRYTFSFHCPQKYLISVVAFNDVGLGTSDGSVSNCNDESCSCPTMVYPTTTKKSILTSVVTNTPAKGDGGNEHHWLCENTNFI